MKKRFLATFLTIVLITVCSISGPFVPTFAHSEYGNVPSLAKNLPIPPVDFDPLQATNAELKFYGFPEKPTDQKALAQWEDVMRHAKHYVEPEQTPTKYVMGLVRTVYPTKWAGYVIKSSDNNNVTYDKAWAKWTHPTSSGTGIPSFWTGIGGSYPSNYIVQAGSVGNAYDINPLLAPVDDAFWVENYPDGLIFQSYPVINPGDICYVYVNYGGATSTAFLENYTTGQYTSVPFNTPYYDGSSIDYIHEAYMCQYGDWGSTSFFQCGYHDNTGNGYLSDGCSYQKDIMTDTGDSQGEWQAWPSTITNSQFTVTSN